MRETQRASKKWTKLEEIENSAIIVADFNTPLSVMDRTTRQKIFKEIQGLNNTLNQLHLTNIIK